MKQSQFSSFFFVVVFFFSFLYPLTFSKGKYLSGTFICTGMTFSHQDKQLTSEKEMSEMSLCLFNKV